MVKQMLIIVVALGGMLVIGCSNQPAPNSPDLDTAHGSPLSMAPSAELAFAYLHVQVGFPNNTSVNVQRVTADWDPTTVTWNSFGGSFSPTVLGSFPATTVGWQQVDITVLVQSWQSGAQENFGVLLNQIMPSFAPALLISSEQAFYPPFLELCYTTGVCDTLSPTGDVYLDQVEPDLATEGTSILKVGLGFVPGEERQVLMRFDLPEITEQLALGSIGDYVWVDSNDDGLQTAGELGMAGVDVNLYDCQDLFLATTITDATGFYLFDSLAAGNFFVEFVAPIGYQFSLADQGADDGLDSDADIVTGRTDCFALGEGEVSHTWDAGLFLIPVDTGNGGDGTVGCTRSKGYWKNHAGFGPQGDEVSQYLSIWLGDDGGGNSLFILNAEMAFDVFEKKTYGSPSNGITKLLAQLLAAKLNLASGASDDAVADVISDADGFVAAHAWTDWDSLDKDTKKAVLEWKNSLDDYNNGEIGPGHCDDEQ